MPRPRRLYPQELVKIAQAQASPPRVSSSSAPSVTIVILTLDRLHLTRRCIESIYANSEYPFTLLIHDDGSEPATLAYLNELQRQYNNVRLDAPTKRVGWAIARNLAFANVKTDYILSLDNDMICHAGFLRETMACAAQHTADFVSPLRLDVNGSVWAFAPELIRTENDTVLEIARWFHDLPLELVQTFFASSNVMTNFISGGAGLFSRAAFQACRGFDEGYTADFEDLDFSLKLVERGYAVWSSPRAVLMHDDEWLPHTEADVEYARARYDAEKIARSAAHLASRWSVDGLPPKLRASFAKRLERKLDGARR